MDTKQTLREDQMTALEVEQPPKPKRTFTLNGVELPCPVDWKESSNGNVAVIDGEIFWFKNKMDADLVRDTLSKIFREARDKP